MVFFTMGGVIHLAEHTFWMAPEADLFHEVVVVTGFSIITVGVLRYSSLQLEYHRLRSETIGKVQLQEPMQQKSQ